MVDVRREVGRAHQSLPLGRMRGGRCDGGGLDLARGHQALESALRIDVVAAQGPRLGLVAIQQSAGGFALRFGEAERLGELQHVHRPGSPFSSADLANPMPRPSR